MRKISDMFGQPSSSKQKNKTEDATVSEAEKSVSTNENKTEETLGNEAEKNISTDGSSEKKTEQKDHLLKVKKDKTLPFIVDTPNQPNSSFVFPKRDIDGRKRYFKHEWLSKFT